VIGEKPMMGKILENNNGIIFLLREFYKIID